MSSLIVPPISSGDGPKYNEDVNLLDEESLETPEEENEEESEESELEIKDKVEEDEEEKQEEDEEEKKPDIPFDRPSIKEIKTQYPDFFEKFPALKDSLFREVEFTKLFPTVEDAQEAFEDNEAFTVLSDAALNGDPAPILESISKTDEKALETFSLSFLPSLYKRNQELYSQAVTPIFENLIRTLYKDKDENTRNAALVLSEFLFPGNAEEIAEGKKTFSKSAKLNEEQQGLKTKRETELNTRFLTSARNVEGKVKEILVSLALKNPAYDPNKVFSPFMRKQGAEEIVKRIMQSLAADKGHMSVMASRWKRARANGYSSDGESKIIATYLARAKSLVSSQAAKVSAAMLGTEKKVSDKKLKSVQTHRPENNSGRVSRSKEAPPKVDYNKMSDMDILEQD
jgi:hypothetical protein